MKDIGVGIIGTGFMGKAHGLAYRAAAGVFPLKREGEDPARMFAGEGDPFRTNRRFHLLAEGQPATRLSTAFDSVTLYGFDPDERPDIYGKVGNSGVSIATLDESSFTCDGRDRCPQMRSCAEARWVLRHCPGTKMDGDGDGIPCETQHCTAEAPALAIAQ